VVHPDFDKLEVGSEVLFLEEAAGEGLQAKRVASTIIPERRAPG